MRAFMTRWFARFARKERIEDDQLRNAVRRAEQVSVDADLGGGVIKRRIARAGGGKSGGYRSLIAFHRGKQTVFIYGFAKNQRDNVSATELEDLKKLARRFLTLNEDQVATALKEGELKEIDCNGHQQH
ncbi:MAG TPA: type II toxin-antitoxin system RelE/ParE family toxin [Bradyrhizobium sp.]